MSGLVSAEKWVGSIMVNEPGMAESVASAAVLSADTGFWVREYLHSVAGSPVTATIVVGLPAALDAKTPDGDAEMVGGVMSSIGLSTVNMAVVMPETFPAASVHSMV